MKRPYDILVIGELNVDIILDKIQSLPETGKEKIAEEMNVVLGSSSAILASNLSSLGAKVVFMGKIGSDTFGEIVLSALEKKSVETAFVKRSQTSTGATVVMSMGNDRANITYPGAMSEFELSDINIDLLDSSRHLHFSSYFLQENLRKDIVKLFRLAKEKGLTTSFDPQWDPEEKWEINLDELLPYVDFFLPNLSELKAITRQPDLDSSLKAIKNYNAILVKMGTKGACYYKKGEKKIYPAILNSEVVDTVGAGDSFNAGFLFRFLQGKSMQECLDFALLTGAVSTTAAGGTAAFKNYEYVINIIRNKLGVKNYETTR
ncbi:MAG: carbohydrate kinase family protein [Cytophagaceae bacterium]|nr:carbohydrate kinase family protein [Cytophagaceae bacterium]